MFRNVLSWIHWKMVRWHIKGCILTSFNLCIKANQSYPEMILPLFSTKDMRWLIYDSFRASYPLQLCYVLTWHDITEILMASLWAECRYGHQIHVPIIHHILDPVWKWEMYLWTFCWREIFPSASSKQRITSCKRAMWIEHPRWCYREKLHYTLQNKHQLFANIECQDKYTSIHDDPASESRPHSVKKKL
jgi:hypothetical protein